MKTKLKHPDAAAIERIGRSNLIEHFQVRRQTVWDWTVNGVPDSLRRPMILYGQSLGLDMSDMKVSA